MATLWLFLTVRTSPTSQRGCACELNPFSLSGLLGWCCVVAAAFTVNADAVNALVEAGATAAESAAATAVDVRACAVRLCAGGVRVMLVWRHPLFV